MHSYVKLMSGFGVGVPTDLMEYVSSGSAVCVIVTDIVSSRYKNLRYKNTTRRIKKFSQ